jgi:hypothetical protein
VKTRAPDKKLPTKVDIIKPIVIERMPALVSNVSGETPIVCSTPKLITRTAIAPIENCRTVAAWFPMRVVMKGFAFRKSSIIASPKPRIMMILKACVRKVDRLSAAAINRS